MRNIIVLGPGLQLQRLRSGRYYAIRLLIEKGNLLLFHLPLLLLHFLLLQELNLCIDLGDGFVRGRWRHHSRWDAGVCGGSGHSWLHLVVHGCRHHHRAVCPGHRCVECLAVRHLHHVLVAIGVLKAKVKMQPIAEVAHAVHVKELLEIIVGTMMHAVVLVVPACGVHHDRSRWYVALGALVMRLIWIVRAVFLVDFFSLSLFVLFGS